jgi:ubiquinol-cytochrome c reductase iron-sulfur subunit
MTTIRVDKRRRWLLGAIAGVTGTLVAGTSVARVLFRSEPVEPEPINTDPVEVDISKIEPGQRLVVEWHGKPAWVVRRTAGNLKDLPTLNDMLVDPHSTNTAQQPAYAQNLLRSIRPEIVVLLGVCTHLGCSPYYRPEIAPEDIGEYWKGGFLCPCHGSRYDLAGRVFKFVPAPDNLPVPPHRYLSDERILIGEDSVDS